MDPLTRSYPMLTPYQFASNRPIDGVDLDGTEWTRSIFWDSPIGRALAEEKVYGRSLSDWQHRATDNDKLDLLVQFTIDVAVQYGLAYTEIESFQVFKRSSRFVVKPQISVSKWSQFFRKLNPTFWFKQKALEIDQAADVLRFTRELRKNGGFEIKTNGLFGGNIKVLSDRSTTVLGRWKGTIEKLKQKGLFHVDGLKFLNVDKATQNVAGQVKYLEGKSYDFFEDFNLPFLEEAVQRGDKIRFTSNPLDPENLFLNGVGGARTTFGKEIQFIEKKLGRSLKPGESTVDFTKKLEKVN